MARIKWAVAGLLLLGSLVIGAAGVWLRRRWLSVLLALAAIAVSVLIILALLPRCADTRVIDGGKPGYRTLRDNPGGTVQAQIPSGTRVCKSAGGGYWVQVQILDGRYRGLEGWMIGQYLIQP